MSSWTMSSFGAELNKLMTGKWNSFVLLMPLLSVSHFNAPQGASLPFKRISQACYLSQYSSRPIASQRQQTGQTCWDTKQALFKPVPETLSDFLADIQRASNLRHEQV